MLTYFATVRAFSRDARLLLAPQALASISFIGIYLVRLGYDTGFIGWINGVSFLSFALFSLPAGMVGARRGVRWALVVGLLVAGIGLALPPLAEFVPAAWQAHWLVITYILAWLGAALYTINFVPFLVGVTEPETRNHVFAFAAAGLPAGAFLGSLLGGLLPGWFAELLDIAPDSVVVYRHSLLLGALLFLLTTPLPFLTRPLIQEAQNHTEDQATPVPYGFMALMALVIVLRLASESAGKAFFTVYLDTSLHVPTASIGTIVSVGQLLAIPAALLTPSC
jgi:MFS family permease